MNKLTKEQIKKYINGEVYYDPHGTYILIRQPEGGAQMLGEIRGWGRIQHMFKHPDGTIDYKTATEFQDAIGHFVANAVNTALESLGEEEVEKTMTQSEFEGFRSMYNAMVEENRLLKADLIREKIILLKIRNNVKIWEDTNPDINVQEYKPIELKPLKNPE